MEWKDEGVFDHSSGITDLVTASQPDFQEACNNLTHNFRLQLLSSRAGYRRLPCPPTPFLIRQLWKLEDWIIAYCYDEPLDPEDQIEGRAYYRLEADEFNPWIEVETPKSRTGATIFRIAEESLKGFTLRTTTASSQIPYDQFVVIAGGSGSNPANVPVITYDGRTIIVTVDETKVEADGRYLMTGVTYLQYVAWLTSFIGLNFTTTLFTGTLVGDEVHFDGHLAITGEANVRSDGDDESLPYIDERGHLSGSEWQSHLYQALEPYIKTFTANPADPFGKDPDTWPPDNNRLPLRKIAPRVSNVGVEPIIYTPKAFNAQLPKTFIGVDTAQTEINVEYSEDALYQVYPLRFEYRSGAYVGDETASIEIWAERSWGQVGAPGAMASSLYLQYDAIVAVASQNLIDPTNPFALIDINLAGVAPYSSLTGLSSDWGKLFLVFHTLDNSSPTPLAIEALSYKETVEFINAAFAEYQTRKAKIGATTYYAAYRNFGYYIRENPKAKREEQLDVSGTTFLDGYYANSLPDDVAGNHRYGFAFYLRDRYEGLFEGSPREFIFDGPTTFIQVKTLSPIGDEPTVGYEDSARSLPNSFPIATNVYGGIAKRILRDTDLYFQHSMTAIFARTLDGGEVHYVDKETRLWYVTDDLAPPVLPQSLIDEGWYDLTAYTVIHESTMPDEELQFKEQAYFNGGVLSYDSLPQGPYYFTIVNQVGYYSNIVNNIQRVYQSTPGIPHSSPGILFNDFDDENSGITAYLDKPILTTPQKIWRIEGVKGADGSGRTFLRTVSDEYGCIANQSMVVTNLGVFLWSSSGIVYTDGLRAFRVSEHLIGRYQQWLSWIKSGGEIGPEELRGRYDELNRLVYWSMKDGDGKSFFVCLSLQKGITSSMPITTHDGIRFTSSDEFGNTSFIDYFETGATLYSDDYQRWYRGQQTFLTVQDETYTYDDSHLEDLRHPILPYYKSIAFAYGMPWARKQTSRCFWTVRDLTRKGVSFQPLGWNDLGQVPERLRGCLNYQHMPFSLEYKTSDLLSLYQFFKHSDAQWKTEMVVAYKRHFGKGRTRNTFKQVGFEALALQYSQLDSTTPGITRIEAIDQAGFVQRTFFLEVTVVSLLSNPFLDLKLDESGQFLVTWEPNQAPVPISTVSLSGNTYRVIVLPDMDQNLSVADFVEVWPTLKFYRRFIDQKLDLVGYNMTYRLIGDRTHGMMKSAEKGGTVA